MTIIKNSIIRNGIARTGIIGTGGGGGGATLLFQDTFTDTPSTLLSAHTADTGQTWDSETGFKIATNGTELELDSGGANEVCYVTNSLSGGKTAYYKTTTTEYIQIGFRIRASGTLEYGRAFMGGNGSYSISEKLAAGNPMTRASGGTFTQEGYVVFNGNEIIIYNSSKVEQLRYSSLTVNVSTLDGFFVGGLTNGVNIFDEVRLFDTVDVESIIL